MIIDQTLMQEAIDVYGKVNQKAIVVEEALELALSLCKLRRGNTGDRIFNLIDETADMNIMVAQLNLMVDHRAVQDRINLKQNRLRGRIDDKRKGIVSHSEVE